MALPNELVDAFVSAVSHEDTTGSGETMCYGTARISGSAKYVQLDGADSNTPATFTVNAHDGDRVLVVLKNHRATVIGNITTPVIMTGYLFADDGIIVNGYLTTSANRTKYNDKLNQGVTFDKDGIGGYGGSSDAYWQLKNDGTFQAYSADLKGKVTATSGAIGGFTIENGKLFTNGHSAWNTNVAGVYLGSDYVSGGRGGVWYFKSDGDFQLGGSSGINYDATTGKISLGSNVSLNWSSISDHPDVPSGILTTSNYTGTINKTYIDGLNVIAQNISATTLSGKTISGGEIYIGTKDTTTNKYPFQVTSDGFLTATSGMIAGWTINGANFYKEVTSGGSTYTAGLYAPASPSVTNNGAFYVKKVIGSTTTYPFLVSYDGTLHATGAEISGTLTAGANSTIGPWKVTDSSIYKNTSGSATTYGTAGVLYFGNDGISLTDKFKVSNAGAITATSGTVGGFTLGTNAFYSNGHLAWNTAADGIYINSSSAPANDVVLSLGSGGKFYVTKAGVPYCNGANLYINSNISTGSSSSLTLQVNSSDMGVINVTGYGNVNTNAFTIQSINCGMYIDSASFVNISGTNINLSGVLNTPSHVYVNSGANIYLVSNRDSSDPTETYNDPGDIVFCAYDPTGNIETGRIWCGGAYDTPLIYFRNASSGSAHHVMSSNGFTTYGNLVSQKGSGEAQVMATNGTNRIYMFANSDGRAGMYSYNSDGTAHNIIGRAAGATTSIFYGNCTGSSASCTGHAASDLALTGGTLSGNVNIVTTGNENNWFQVENNLRGVRLAAHNSCGVYATKPTAKWLIYMDADGNIISNATGSDIRLKKNVGDTSVKNALDVLRKFKMRSFDWKENDVHWKIGMVADELEEIDPLLTQGGGYEEDGSINIKTVNTFYLQGYIVKAIQELYAMLEETNQRIAV